MDLQTAAAGLIEVRAPGEIAEVDDALVIDLTGDASDVFLEVNGRQFTSTSAAGLASSLRAQRDADSGRLMSIPYDVAVEGARLILRPGAALPGLPLGACLTGSAASAAIRKAERVVSSEIDAWPTKLGASAIETADMDAWTAGPRWDGPLVVSMPRTGSTLMGVLFLFCRDSDSPSGARFDRYIHEPVAPVFWRGDDLGSVARLADPALGARDVVQESAYQFADPRVARWFLSQARQPVIFTMRHPQISWPSRWRAMLAQRIAERPSDPITEAARAAIAADDYTDLGAFVTESVRPADNGFYAFVSMLDMCLRDGIDFVIVDNTSFRAKPEATLRELCRRLGIDFDRAMTEWTDLEKVLPRVVMSDLAQGDEYQWYYAQTLGSHRGIEPETRAPVPADRFPERLRGLSGEHLTIDEAATWYQLLLARPETLR